MKIIKSLLLAVFNNKAEANKNSVLAVKSKEDLTKLIEDAKNSKLNPMAFSNAIPFCTSTQEDTGLGIDAASIVGTLYNFNIFEGLHSQDNSQAVLYLVSDVLIDDNFYQLLAPMVSPIEGTNFYALQSGGMLAFGLKGITSRIEQNVEEVMQIITFDLVLNINKQNEAPIIDGSSAVIVESAGADSADNMLEKTKKKVADKKPAEAKDKTTTKATAEKATAEKKRQKQTKTTSLLD